jgi:hypothetical protein
MQYHFDPLQSLLPPAGMARELADRDAHMLLDIGLVRSADGSLRLAEDPSQKVRATPRSGHRILAALTAAVRSMRSRLRPRHRRAVHQSCLGTSL